MDRRRAALVLLLLFVGCTGVAIVLSGSRPGLEQGLAPAITQFVGYVLALGAAVLLIASPEEDPSVSARRIGGTVLAALGVLVLLDLLAEEGPNIGAGLVRLVALVAIMGATGRLALGVAAAGRTG